jgi:hypothetical protein
VTDLSEQLDECIYPKTEEVLYASPDDETFDAIFLVEFQPDDSGNVPINLYAISEALGLQVTEHELQEDERDYVALAVRHGQEHPCSVVRAPSSARRGEEAYAGAVRERPESSLA